MNEWSTKGFYSGSPTTDLQLQTQVHPQYWGENWDQTHVNAGCGINGYNLNDYQKSLDFAHQYLSESTGNPLTYVSKKKKNYGPDPRFMRLISTEGRCNGDREAEKLDSTQRDLRLFYDPKNENLVFFPKCTKEESANRGQDMSSEVTKDLGLEGGFAPQHVQKYHDVKTSEKTRKNSLTKLKRTASDCTLNRKKPYENGNEITEKARAHPSATRLANAQNWAKSDKGCPEKRRSVITVIGQTQTKPLSKILSEINQRRKLAKELDKHALCAAIMGSAESQPEVKNIVAKVDLLLPDGKVIYSMEKVYRTKDSKFTGAGILPPRSVEVLEGRDQTRKRFVMVPEKDSPGDVVKKNKTRRSSKKVSSPTKEKRYMKDYVTRFSRVTSSVVLLLVFAMFCLSLFFSFFFGKLKTPQLFCIGGFFKPKTTTWYEKLLFL